MSESDITRILHVLILEDRDSDADLVEWELRKAEIPFTARRVARKEQFLEEIVSQTPDIILSDYSLPQFSGIEALRLVKAHDCAAPFILVTGSQTEEVAVQCMREGAADYILKSSLTRLPSAVLTALKRSETEKEKVEALEALRQSQEELRQAQKLEAIGQLAGGIAHDFNNLLTVIGGYCELLLRAAELDESAREKIEEVKSAAERASSLTRQLLAFSRKQVLKPELLDPNSLVEGIGKMLRRLIGEDVEVITSLTPDVGTINADPSQIEQVLINLVVNARDAMPNGGTIIIETANVELDQAYSDMHIAVNPGPYIMLAVSDTGTGMDAETVKHMFEPFFTTKELGRGTGLGLSTIYGIVKQSGGNIWVYSELGKGTTFKIYLPLADNDQAKSSASKQPQKAVTTANETILLVEDEEIVRKLTGEILKATGYKVLLAKNGQEAIEICQAYGGTIDLMLTDVVMPGMNGKMVADNLKPFRPEMQVLFMSGYTDDSIIHHGVLDPGTNFLDKPFTVDALTSKVRETLNRALQVRNETMEQ
jgi:signal transduction histidine kinase